jgi:hypothetical protein
MIHELCKLLIGNNQSFSKGQMLWFGPTTYNNYHLQQAKDQKSPDE